MTEIHIGIYDAPSTVVFLCIKICTLSSETYTAAPILCACLEAVHSNFRELAMVSGMCFSSKQEPPLNG